jgi:hypothetical protein
MDEYFRKDTLNDVQNWLVEITYWSGWLRGLRAGQKQNSTSGVIHLYDSVLRPDELEYCWFRHHGRIYLSIYEKVKPFSFASDGLASITLGGRTLNERLIFGHDSPRRFSDVDLVGLVEEIEQRIRQFFPEISARNSYRICSSQTHLISIIRGQGRVNSQQILELCSRIGDRWLCEECVGRFDLDSDQPVLPEGLNKKQGLEFARLKPALRLAILERDSYTCSGCKRSPMKGDDVRLRVVHKVAVSAGGKTVNDNLTTICGDCLKQPVSSPD